VLASALMVGWRGGVVQDRSDSGVVFVPLTSIGIPSPSNSNLEMHCLFARLLFD
jgi:hypothetical protein